MSSTVQSNKRIKIYTDIMDEQRVFPEYNFLCLFILFLAWLVNLGVRNVNSTGILWN